MSILGALSVEEFLQRYWQREPLALRQVVPDLEGVVDSDDLAALAGEEEVDSRLVILDERNREWRCENGPFTETRFQALPERRWTLLVQA